MPKLVFLTRLLTVALRKESVDRNNVRYIIVSIGPYVALRKESVDRNHTVQIVIVIVDASLSARRAWIEMLSDGSSGRNQGSRSPQGERG